MLYDIRSYVFTENCRIAKIKGMRGEIKENATEEAFRTPQKGREKIKV
jgi:hypothetical protein